jgi:hypothetical protein
MSFSVDMWNGFEEIKNRINLIKQQMKNFQKLLISYLNNGKEYCKNLDLIYKESFDTAISNSPLEQSRINMIRMLGFEAKQKREFIDEIEKNILVDLNKTFSEPQGIVDEICIEKEESKQNFNKMYNQLVEKQENFHYQCKELCITIAQMKLDNKACLKINKIMINLLKSRDEYIDYINEVNILRSKLIREYEENLNTLESIYKNLISRFKDCLLFFSVQKNTTMGYIYNKEQLELEHCHSMIDLDKELFMFVSEKATKEFPMVKIDFCPLKQNFIQKLIRTKFQKCFTEEQFTKIFSLIQDYLVNYSIFPENLILSGVSKLNGRNASLFGKMDDKKNAMNGREMMVMNNVRFIKNFISELVSNNTVKIREDRLYDYSQIGDEKLAWNTNTKMEELKYLVDIHREGSSVYIEAIIKTLSFLRSKGIFELKEDAYNYIKEIFIKILNENSSNDYILKNVILLAQTFYIMRNSKKIYLQKELRGNPVLNSTETWHRCINYSLNLANHEKDLTIQVKKNDFIQKINKEAFHTVLSYLCDLKFFSNDEEVYNKVRDFYVKLYSLDISAIQTHIDNYIVQMIDEKDITDINKKDDIDNKKIKNKIDEINDENNKKEIIIHEKKK